MTTATASYINRPVIWSAQRGIVTGQQTERRGRVLLTVKLETGREIKVALTSVEFNDVERFAPPTGSVHFGPEDRDYYGDQALMFARRTY